MGQRYYGDYDGGYDNRSPQETDLLGSGWRPLQRDFVPDYFWKLAWRDPGQLTQKTLDLASDLADMLGRQNFTWWANLLSLFSDSTRYEIDEFWSYITPEPPGPDYRFQETISTETPIVQAVSRTNIPIDFVLNRLQELIVLKILEIVGKPELITQQFGDRYFYYPVEKFTSWEKVQSIGTVYAFWPQHQLWLEIHEAGQKQRRYTLMAKKLSHFVSKATYNLAVMLSGYQSRVGKIHSQFPIASFPQQVQSFTDVVQQKILEQEQLAVLVSGEPGTGKTAWTQAVAKEILAPLGYVIFILDHDGVDNFIPPTYLEKICLIVNEADNLAKNRALEAAQTNNKTEHILSLLDGTLYQSVIDEEGIHYQQRLVVLMTCNTTERLDPALLRKGRVDLISEFTHKFV